MQAAGSPSSSWEKRGQNVVLAELWPTGGAKGKQGERWAAVGSMDGGGGTYAVDETTNGVSSSLLAQDVCVWAFPSFVPAQHCTQFARKIVREEGHRQGAATICFFHDDWQTAMTLRFWCVHAER